MTYSLTFTPPLTPADQIVFQAAYGGTLTGSSTGTTTAPLSPNDPSYYPANQGLATQPSPENATSSWISGAVVGAPYLYDKNGLLYQIKDATSAQVTAGTLFAAPENGARAYINGIAICNGSYPVTEMIVRQGLVYFYVSSGQVQLWNPGMAAAYNASLPPAWSSSASGTSTDPLPPLAAAPTPQSPAPGSSGNTVTCGLGTTLTSITAGLAACGAGDTLVVKPGTYIETPPAITKQLHIIATGATLNATGLTATLARGKGLLVPDADCIIDGITVTGVALDQTIAQLTCAIRPDSNCGYLTLNGVTLTASQCGLGMGGFVCDIAMNNSLVSGCGLPAGNAGNGYAHNIYVGGGGKLTLNNTSSVSPVGGHAVKSRMAQYSSAGGSFDATDASPIDLPDGTTAPFSITGVTITKPAASANHAVFTYGEESQTNGMAGGTIAGTIAALCPNPFIQTNGGTITVSANKTGGTISVQGGGIVIGL